MTRKTCRPAVSKRAVGCCKTAHGADRGLTSEQSAENREVPEYFPRPGNNAARRVGTAGFPAVTTGRH